MGSSLGGVLPKDGWLSRHPTPLPKYFSDRRLRGSVAPNPARSSALLLLVRIPMDRIDPEHGLGLLDRLDVEIDRDRLAVTAHQHAFQHLVAAGVDLLMRHVRRHEDEIAGVGLGGELQLLAPARPRLALHDIDDA